MNKYKYKCSLSGYVMKPTNIVTDHMLVSSDGRSSDERIILSVLTSDLLLTQLHCCFYFKVGMFYFDLYYIRSLCVVVVVMFVVICWSSVSLWS